MFDIVEDNTKLTHISWILYHESKPNYQHDRLETVVLLMYSNLVNKGLIIKSSWYYSSKQGTMGGTSRG
jgi:hypothetical protein